MAAVGVQVALAGQAPQMQVCAELLQLLAVQVAPELKEPAAAALLGLCTVMAATEGALLLVADVLVAVVVGAEEPVALHPLLVEVPVAAGVLVLLGLVRQAALVAAEVRQAQGWVQLVAMVYMAQLAELPAQTEPMELVALLCPVST